MTLNRFIFKAIEKYHIFFQLIKKAKKEVYWTSECENAFQQLKNYMAQPPLLAMPIPGEILLLYLVVSECAVSLILVQEVDKIQRVVYYTSKALLDAET